MRVAYLGGGERIRSEAMVQGLWLRKEERGKRKEERGKRKEERGKRKEERGEKKNKRAKNPYWPL